ncbi:hypothetical protein [Nostoc sp. ChiQUE01b]|uniref:hypothetical protein n=1 Tax=Nostoc sp. ChiQUE01b TaxID=3075376 RepID=UPI002AD43485|nr:hypothetical protein [Nostoc sp. ChiQUE01b]
MQANFEQKAFISLVGLKPENLPVKEIRLQDLSSKKQKCFFTSIGNAIASSDAFITLRKHLPFLNSRAFV